MHEKPEYFEDLDVTLENHLADGIAAAMATEAGLTQPEDMADLFLSELNSLWSDPAPLESL